jgi:hypothetical protein
VTRALTMLTLLVPAGPAGPARPALPAAPACPVGPWGPIGPVAPSAPGTPCAPAGPRAPAGPLAPLGPRTFHRTSRSTLRHARARRTSRSWPAGFVQPSKAVGRAARAPAERADASRAAPATGSITPTPNRNRASIPTLRVPVNTVTPFFGGITERNRLVSCVGCDQRSPNTVYAGADTRAGSKRPLCPGKGMGLR